MIKPSDPRDLTVNLLSRSTCAIKTAAVVADKHGIFGWGWNSMGPTGLGIHAEAHCIQRSNKSRLDGATIYIAAERTRNNKAVSCPPCVDCHELIINYDLKVIYRGAQGVWWRIR